jgi:hypothetical protein
MESFFSTVKSELRDRFDSCGEAKMALFDYIEVFYNQRRRHSTLGQISPGDSNNSQHDIFFCQRRGPDERRSTDGTLALTPVRARGPL